MVAQCKQTRVFYIRPSTGISLDLSCNFSFLLSLGFRQVEILLQIQPKLRACPEITSQTKSSFWSNGAAPMHDLPNAGCRDVYVHRELVLANPERLQELLQQHFTGMSRNPLERPTCIGPLNSTHVFFP